jgi:hypothetical protein
MIRTVPAVLALVLALGAAPVAAQDRPESWQVAAAVLPLPDSMRSGAAVLGYRGGRLVELRAGRNEMICLTDDPAGKGFQASCYHRSLEPFMARGRALRADGVTRREQVDSARLADVKSGRIVMPSAAVLSSVFAESDSFDPAAGPAPGQRALDVIYLPYATQETTGIPEIPATDRPWLMFAGMPWAHVMVTR